MWVLVAAAYLCWAIWTLRCAIRSGRLRVSMFSTVDRRIEPELFWIYFVVFGLFAGIVGAFVGSWGVGELLRLP